MKTLTDIQLELRQFADQRNWDQFHSPKNLVMALSVEVSELLEHFQWLSEDQSRCLDVKTKAAVQEEIADVQIYLIRIADKLGINILESVEQKIEKTTKNIPLTRCEEAQKNIPLILKTPERIDIKNFQSALTKLTKLHMYIIESSNKKLSGKQMSKRKALESREFFDAYVDSCAV